MIEKIKYILGEKEQLLGKFKKGKSSMCDFINENLQIEDLEVLGRRGFELEAYIDDFYDDNLWDSED